LNSFIDPKLIYEYIHKYLSHPVIVIENKIDYGNFIGCNENENFLYEYSNENLPHVKISPRDAKPDITLISYGGIAREVEKILLDIFVKTELIPELFILSQISPFNIQPFEESIRNSGRVIFIEEGSANFGIGSEIVSEILEMNIDNLKLARRIGAKPVPIPSTIELERVALPNLRLIEEIIKILV